MSITKRKNKNGVVYEVKIPYTDKFGNKKTYYKRFPKKTDALNHERSILMKKQEDGYLEISVKKTVNDVFDEFIQVAPAELQENTIYNMRNCKKYFENEIGKMQIDKVGYFDLQNYFLNRADKGIETNKKIQKALNRTFIHAIRCGYIKSNPIVSVKVTGIVAKKEIKVLSYDEVNSIVLGILERPTFKRKCYAVAIWIGYYTGLRVSEVFALEKSDFNFDQMTVSVTKKLVTKGLKRETFNISNQTKTRASESCIPIPNQLKNILNVWFDENPFNKVICDEDGYYVNPDLLGNCARTIGKKLGIQFHFHLLRHTFATNCYLNNVDPKITQLLMRHAKYSTTAEIYTHVSMLEQRETINKIFTTPDKHKNNGSGR